MKTIRRADDMTDEALNSLISAGYTVVKFYRVRQKWVSPLLLASTCLTILAFGLEETLSLLLSPSTYTLIVMFLLVLCVAMFAVFVRAQKDWYYKYWLSKTR